MRIAYVLTSLGIGGAERQALQLAERMAARGHAVSFVVLLGRQAEEWPTALDPAGVFRLDMRKTPASLLAGVEKARAYLRGFRPELIHSHTYPANLLARIAGWPRPQVPVLSTIHSIYEGHWPRLLSYRLTDFLSRRTVLVSRSGAALYVRRGVVPARKCTVIANGIDTAEFAPSGERRLRLRAAMEAKENFIWLAAGRITPAKDYPNLLRAFRQAQAAFSQTQLWVAGEGMGSAVAAVRALADGLGLGSRVRWLGLRRDMPALLDAADGFVLSSAWEGMPLAVGEAMAMEKPVTATDVGGVRELVGETGVLVPAGNPQRLGDAMLAVMRASPALRGSLGHAARQRIESRFNIEARTEEWEALYRAVLAGGG
ncbi:MAG: glycosyltransferase [Terracidiphilus sp.]